MGMGVSTSLLACQSGTQAQKGSSMVMQRTCVGVCPTAGLQSQSHRQTPVYVWWASLQSTRVSKPPGNGAAAEQPACWGMEMSHLQPRPSKPSYAWEIQAWGPSILLHSQSPTAQRWGACCHKTLSQAAGTCSPSQTLLRVTAPTYGAKPKVGAPRSHTPHGLATMAGFP